MFVVRFTDALLLDAIPASRRRTWGHLIYRESPGHLGQASLSAGSGAVVNHCSDAGGQPKEKRIVKMSLVLRAPETMYGGVTSGHVWYLYRVPTLTLNSKARSVKYSHPAHHVGRWVAAVGRIGPSRYLRG
ncbi:predicted protein [Coccidioides posadasii str. Silveira]|uniref:Predicted protein n=2 Tax=Coccidioides posadasii TaxID=199306 RepID=E9CZR4_COCPS|nr:predicted protein [Coccidioides posadasii str. Silveira]KMM73268.1 hypothetical protein CPAG_09557 [Coccidioides posadasii RMSCC 3488]